MSVKEESKVNDKSKLYDAINAYKPKIEARAEIVEMAKKITRLMLQKGVGPFKNPDSEFLNRYVEKRISMVHEFSKTGKRPSANAVIGTAHMLLGLMSKDELNSYALSCGYGLNWNGDTASINKQNISSDRGLVIEQE